jgi:DNA-binding Lrp family transcriptional regulator
MKDQNVVTRNKTPQDRKVEELRAAMIAIERACGAPLAAIASKYGISEKTVKKDLQLAAESGFIDHYKALLHEQLVPKALAVYEAQLLIGNLEAARDVMQGLGIFQKQVDATKLKGKMIRTLDDYKRQRLEAVGNGTGTGEVPHDSIQ